MAADGEQEIVVAQFGIVIERLNGGKAFLGAVWSLDPQSPAFIEERKREMVKTVMARIAP